MVRRAIVLLVLALALLGPLNWTPATFGASSFRPRVFYLASGGTLSSSRPIGNSASTSNLTQTSTFSLQPFLTSTTISGQLTVAVYASWVGNTSWPIPPRISASFDYKLAGQNWSNTTTNNQAMVPMLAAYNLTLNIQLSSLPELTTVAVGVHSSNVPRNANVTLEWGSAGQPSLVELPLSGYLTFVQSNPVNIVDLGGNSIQYFPLNASPGNNIVEVRAHVTSALGYTDISRVNMTIVDPNLRPVRQEDMQPEQSTPANPPFDYIATWSYPTNSTQGTYQVWLDIIDVQGNVAISYRGPASFGLVPPGFIPPPFNLIPYILVAGAAGVGSGAIYYRRRKRKSYLAPFDHFNTLTGGGLEGGTVVTIEGNTGSGKTLLSEQLMYEDLRNGRPCVFVSTGDFPNNIRSKMKTMGFDVSGYEQSGLLTFVDCYSAEAGQESREKVSVPSLGDLTTLGVKISSTLPPNSFKGGGLYFDSLSPLASKAKPDTIVSFVQSVGARVKGLSGKAFFTVGQGIDGSVQRQLQENADCIVQMEAFEESGTRKRRLRISKLRARTHQEGWTEFTIEDGKGIIFYSRKSRKQSY